MKVRIDKIIIKDRVRKEFKDIEDLAESIKEIGLIQPIVVTYDNVLIAGHRRLLACRRLNYLDIEVVVIDPKDELHKLDMEMAENVKRDDFNPVDLAEGLLKRKQLYEVLHPETKHGGLEGQAGGGKKAKKTDSDSFVKETSNRLGKSETFIKETLQLNDLSQVLKEQIRENTLTKSEALAVFRKEKRKNEIISQVKEISGELLNIYQGDCLEQITKLKDNSIACIIIDPPYGIHYQSNQRLAKHEFIKDDNINAFKLLDNSLKLVFSKMLDNSHIYIFTSWKVIDIVKPIVEKYFTIKTCLIWNKKTGGMGDLEGNYSESYEMIIFGSKGNRKLLVENRPSNILAYSRTLNNYHPTEKPVDLIKELIQNSTVEGEIVLDYFAGSGSTLIASKLLNRVGIAIELEQEFINIIKKRVVEYVSR